MHRRGRFVAGFGQGVKHDGAEAQFRELGAMRLLRARRGRPRPLDSFFASRLFVGRRFAGRPFARRLLMLLGFARRPLPGSLRRRSLVFGMDLLRTRLIRSRLIGMRPCMFRLRWRSRRSGRRSVRPLGVWLRRRGGALCLRRSRWARWMLRRARRRLRLCGRSRGSRRFGGRSYRLRYCAISARHSFPLKALAVTRQRQVIIVVGVAVEVTVNFVVQFGCRRSACSLVIGRPARPLAAASPVALRPGTVARTRAAVWIFVLVILRMCTHACFASCRCVVEGAGWTSSSSHC